MKKVLFALAILSLFLAIDAKLDLTHTFDSKTGECKIFDADKPKAGPIFKGKRANNSECLKQVNKLGAKPAK